MILNQILLVLRKSGHHGLEFFLSLGTILHFLGSLILIAALSSLLLVINLLLNLILPFHATLLETKCDITLILRDWFLIQVVQTRQIQNELPPVVTHETHTWISSQVKR